MAFVRFVRPKTNQNTYIELKRTQKSPFQAEVGSTWMEPGRVRELAADASNDRNMRGQKLCLAVAAAQDILQNCSSKAKGQRLLAQTLLNEFHCNSSVLSLKNFLIERLDWKSKTFTTLKLNSERHLRRKLSKERPQKTLGIPIPAGPIRRKSRSRSPILRGVWKDSS